MYDSVVTEVTVQISVINTRTTRVFFFFRSIRYNISLVLFYCTEKTEKTEKSLIVIILLLFFFSNKW